MWRPYPVAPVTAVQAKVGVDVVSRGPGPDVLPGDIRVCGDEGIVAVACVVKLDTLEKFPSVRGLVALLKACTFQ